MEVAISTGLYYTKNHHEILDIIVASGCKRIELFLNQAFIDLSVEEIKEAIDERGLIVSSIHLPLTFIAYKRNENEGYWIEKGLKYLEILGGEILVTHFFYKPDNHQMNNDISHLANIAYYSEVTDKLICTENLPNIEMDTVLKDQSQLIEKLSINKGCMTFDITHAASHNRCIIAQYGQYKNYIRNIHLSDYLDGNEHKVIGTGNLPIERFIKLLKKDGYKYPITIEYDFENPTRNDVKSDEEAIQLLSDSIEMIEACLN